MGSSAASAVGGVLVDGGGSLDCAASALFGAAAEKSRELVWTKFPDCLVLYKALVANLEIRGIRYWAPEVRDCENRSDCCSIFCQQVHSKFFDKRE